MQRHTVQSTALQSVGYDTKTKILELEFKDSGGVWQYFGFQKAMFTKFISAASLGSFFVKKIKGRYPELKVS